MFSAAVFMQDDVIQWFSDSVNVDLQSLADALEGDTHGYFEDVLVALVTPPAQFDMQEIRKAIKVRALQASYCYIWFGFFFFPVKDKEPLFVPPF